MKSFKGAGFFCALLVGLHVALGAPGEITTNDTAAPNRLASIVSFTFQKGTNKPISAATSRALGIGDEAVPSTQVAILFPGETQVHGFGVSSRNTNDLTVSLIDKNTRSGKVWLTLPAGEIRKTVLVSSNKPPELVPNERYAEEFVKQIGIWLQVCTPPPTNHPTLSGDSESLGEIGADSSGTVREISDRFGHDELNRLYQLLNSKVFQSKLTNYNCGDPVPRLDFSVSLRAAGNYATRAVEIYHSPGLSPGGRTRCLLFGMGYLLDKAVTSLDPNPKQETAREPHCDCAKRDGKEEWVSFPGPDEILAPAKVAEKVAARKADEALEEKEENLTVTHLNPAARQIEPKPAGEHLVTREKSLGRLPATADMNLFAFDPSFNHWACVVKRNGKQFVVLDGVEGKEFDEIPDHQRLAFSADGKHFAYIGRRGDKMLVVRDGKEQKPYDRIEELFHPIFSPDGNRLAYIATKRVLAFPPEQSFAVVDGVEQKGYDLVEGIFFSPDSRHLAYNADKKWNRGTVLVVDGKEGKSYDQITGGCFSPDGDRLIYVAYRRTDKNSEVPGLDFAVLDGMEQKSYRSVSSCQFSPDSKHIAYVAAKGSTGMKMLVCDGDERNYGNLELGPFSPDSKHLACVALFGTNWWVLIDGKKLDPQERVLTAERGFSPLHDLTFSPDSQHLAYIARKSETNWSVMLDGKTINTCGGFALSPIFSPDSRRLAYVIRRGEKNIPVFGEREGNEYDQLFTWRGSLAEGAKFFGLGFDEKGTVHAMAMRDREIFRLDLELVKD